MDSGSLVALITGSSSLFLAAANWWSTHKTTNIAEHTEERNKEREPLVHESLNLRNAGDAMGMMSLALETAEDVLKRSREDLRDFKAESEQTIGNLKREIDRLRNEVTENSCNNTPVITAIVPQLAIDPTHTTVTQLPSPE